MGGGHHVHRPFPGAFVPPHVNPTIKKLSTAVGCTFWLWLFYRAKQDGAALLGLEKPWEHGHHGHGDSHGSDHGGKHH